uniref:Uncharacterized protein n=1 Tax=Arundo donax TaxID=35708 RepID=A0A0A8Y1S0_ARUDO
MIICSFQMQGHLATLLSQIPNTEIFLGFSHPSLKAPEILLRTLLHADSQLPAISLVVHYRHHVCELKHLPSPVVHSPQNLLPRALFQIMLLFLESIRLLLLFAK